MQGEFQEKVPEPADADERNNAYAMLAKMKTKDALVMLWVRLSQTVAIVCQALQSLGLGQDGIPLDKGGIPWTQPEPMPQLDANAE